MRQGTDMEQADKEKCTGVLNGFCSSVDFNLAALYVLLD